MNSTAGDGREYTRLSQFINVLKSALVQESKIVSDTVNDPSTLTPAVGARYIVGPSPIGAWATKARQIALWQGSWSFLDPTNQIFQVVASGRVTYYEGLYYLNGLSNQGNYQDVGTAITILSRAEVEAIAIEAAIVFGG